MKIDLNFIHTLTQQINNHIKQFPIHYFNYFNSLKIYKLKCSTFIFVNLIGVLIVKRRKIHRNNI